MGNNLLKCLEKVVILNLLDIINNWKLLFWFMLILNLFWKSSEKIIGIIFINHIMEIIKSIVLVAMGGNFYLLIKLVNLNKNIEVRVQFIILLVKCLKKWWIAGKIIKKHFKKELFMSKGNQRNLTKTNKRHICNKSYSEKDINVKDHCHITGEYWESANQIWMLIIDKYKKYVPFL